MKPITSTTLLSGRVDVVDLGYLFVGLLPRRIAKVYINVDTACVIQTLSAWTFRAEDTAQDRLWKE